MEGKYKQWPVSNDEADMVQEVVDVVEEKCEEGRFPEPFATQIRQRNLSFTDARRLIHEASVNSRWPVPDRIDLYNNKCWRYGHHHQTYPTQIPVEPPMVPSYRPMPPVHHEKTQGYRFNYLPVDRTYEPEIFGSRVGEHGVYKGHRF